MNYLSVCSGIEAATVAWHDLGWNPVGFSEIEKFPSEVLKHHYPTVTNFGDMTKYKEWQIDGTVGLLVGGTPCQSFSVAGLRKGLEDPRGNLALTYCGILDHFRPKWFVWENVPGVLSSNGGKDFSSFLSAVVELGYGFSYRVLDAQYFGVAQRRRRVFVVGHLGDWKPTAKILFESESLSRNIKESRKKGEAVAKNALPSIVGTLDTECGGAKLSHQTATNGHIIPTYWNGNQKADCLTAKGDDQRMPDKNRFQAVIETYGIPGNWIGRKPENGGNATTPMNDIAPCLTKTDRHGVANNMAVRRLTPVECERLQGFPDNYTNIKEKCPDGPRYKALGNSMAVPVMKWIGQRIKEYENGTSN